MTDVKDLIAHFPPYISHTFPLAFQEAETEEFLQKSLNYNFKHLMSHAAFSEQLLRSARCAFLKVLAFQIHQTAFK